MHGTRMLSLNWYYKRSVDTLRYDGVHILLWRTLKMGLLPLGHLGFATLYEKDLSQPLAVIQAKVDVTINQAGEDDIDQLATLVARRYGPTENLEWYSKCGIRDTILQRFRQGQRCFVGRIGTQIVHYNWIFFRWEESVPGTGCFIHLKDDEALCNDTFTLEPWRGRAIHTASNSQMLLFLQQSGYRKAYTVASSSRSARKTLDRVAWEHSGTMLYFIPRGAQKAWIWRIQGTLAPFVFRQTPVYRA